MFKLIQNLLGNKSQGSKTQSSNPQSAVGQSSVGHPKAAKAANDAIAQQADMTPAQLVANNERQVREHFDEARVALMRAREATDSTFDAPSSHVGKVEALMHVSYATSQAALAFLVGTVEHLLQAQLAQKLAGSALAVRIKEYVATNGTFLHAFRNASEVEPNLFTDELNRLSAFNALLVDMDREINPAGAQAVAVNEGQSTLAYCSNSLKEVLSVLVEQHALLVQARKDEMGLSGSDALKGLSAADNKVFHVLSATATRSAVWNCDQLIQGLESLAEPGGKPVSKAVGKAVVKA